MRERVQRAPNLFARAAVVLDFGGLSKAPDLDDGAARWWKACAAPACCRWRWPTAPATSTHSPQQLGLPLLAKFRAQYERAGRCAGAAPRQPPRAAEPPAARRRPGDRQRLPRPA